MSIPDPTRHLETTGDDAVIETGELAVTAVAIDEEEHVRPSVALMSDAGSTDRVAAFAEAHIGVRAQVAVDGDVVSQPRISTPIAGGVLSIRIAH